MEDLKFIIRILVFGALLGGIAYALILVGFSRTATF